MLGLVNCTLHTSAKYRGMMNDGILNVMQGATISPMHCNAAVTILVQSLLLSNNSLKEPCMPNIQCGLNLILWQ